MPEELWQEAVRIGHIHGVYAVSRGLRVNYDSLKRRLAPQLPATTPGRAPAFLEVAIDQVISPAGCSVEVVRPDGARLTIRTTRDADLGALTSAFLTAGR